MYAGRIVEEGDVFTIFRNPAHPYTRALLRSVPQLGQKEKLYVIPGQVPQAGSYPSGCPFHPRCERSTEICTREFPEYRGDKHRFACHNFQE